MRKRLLALLLTLTMVLPVPVLAAENSADNFVRSKTYAGEFSDLTPDSTFYSNVSALYEYGLSQGKTDGTFGLKDSVTVSQIIIFAARIRSLYVSGDAEAGAAAYRTEGQQTYEPYLAYLQAQGVLDTELSGTYFTAATRAQVAHVLAATLPANVLSPINQDLVTEGYATRRYITDVTEYTDYYQDILSLYKWGVSVGADAKGSYLPDAPITRGAVAAMLTRMVDPSLRLTPDWVILPTYSAQGTSWSDLITGNTTYLSAPSSQTEIAQDVAYMLSQERSVLTLDYDRRISLSFVNQVMNEALSEVKSYCEQLYNSVSCNYSTETGRIVLTFSDVSSGSSLSEYRDYTLSAAIAVHDQLWANGQITSSMSDYEKAKVYFTWICQNCTYDYSAGTDSISHIAYALFKNGTAVCDGYTGAYNLLLKLEGIDCYALSNSEHIWTVATLDGTEYHIDTTWGDSAVSIDYSYFAMTPQQSWKYHQW